MSPVERPELPASVENLVARLVRVFSPEQVWLFGSYASGNATSRRHVVQGVVLASEDDALELTRRRQQLVAGCFPRVDLVPATQTEFAHARGERAAFLRGVVQHGVALHLPGATAAVRPDQPYQHTLAAE
ncbi:MAG: nucleotidyltransferase domain-containing protein [Arenimonas sp.]|uniref:nucleotidyltransferase domain-containing protein n=1 Tax=Arenimonas sp. TaxID=1872635 RepID=UPI0025BA09E0|nr:nucleotidyltransferase domain-containing protein [Arenimonas sp.]MBW8366367.1 nucleotidyltransferase domain-containing protein [Arenimonas sp.]